jgi:NAD dependent epimerase/dehydratase
MSRRALVTGAGGFIGSHLCEKLVADGWTVRALCRYTSRRDPGNLVELPDAVFAELDVQFGDLLDSDRVRTVMSDVDTVFHLGASISVPYSYVAPREVVKTNIEGTLNALAAAVDLGTERFVQMSSSEVYGTAQYAPIDEEHPLHAQSPYAASKVGADKLAETFHLTYGLSAVVARPFNTYGPRQSQRAVIGAIVAQALAGDGLRLGSLVPRRDFAFVEDTVDALVRLGSRTDLAGETFNIATGHDVSVGRVVELVGEIVGRELSVTTTEERLRPDTSEVFRLIGSAEKLRAATGWTPTTSLEDGLRAVVDWRRGTRPSDVQTYAL